eukprot:2105380-Pleurochrysis_carterae.AAC.1
MEVSVVATMTMDQVLVQCNSVRTPEARVVTMNTAYPGEEWRSRRMQMPAPCHHKVSALVPLAIPDPV